ncbi:hypothetical protein ABT392_05500 [Paucibacter sp. JuS9]|uniref:AbiU2 domain-containing protein n=1 Tax=Paucibacter sp. JuS9 TaxID=3228748 RepID=UPI003758247B
MIKVASAEEFKRLIEALAYDVESANIHWRLYVGVHAAIGESRCVYEQSATFWHLTFNAHTFTALQFLSRAFDQEQRSLHLLSWLKTIEANLHLFEPEEFKKRLAGNPFAESLAECSRSPDPDQLKADIALCMATDPDVNLLVRHRNSIGAHRSARAAVTGLAPDGVPVDVLERLLDRAHTILNRYSSLFAASTYSRQMLGHDDYRYVVSSVSQAVERSRTQHGDG